jgi:hypothetical protein
MAASTGPILAVGAISFTNGWILNKQPPDFKILLGTAVAAGGLALFEHVSKELAVGIAWIALVTVLFTRQKGKPSPAENLLRVSGL